MNCLLKYSIILIVWFIAGTAFADARPTISFNGTTYYLAKSHYEVDGTLSPVNVVEFYLPEGQTSDNYSKYIKRVTLLQVQDFKSSVKGMLHEFMEDNKNIPYKIENEESKKIILNVSFWWPFRPTVVAKHVYVFQEDLKAHRAMYYLVGEDVFYNSANITNEELIKQGKALLIDQKIVDQAKDLAF